MPIYNNYIIYNYCVALHIIYSYYIIYTISYHNYYLTFNISEFACDSRRRLEILNTWDFVYYCGERLSSIVLGEKIVFLMSYLGI